MRLDHLLSREYTTMDSGSGNRMAGSFVQKMYVVHYMVLKVLKGTFKRA